MKKKQLFELTGQSIWEIESSIRANHSTMRTIIADFITIDFFQLLAAVYLGSYKITKRHSSFSKMIHPEASMINALMPIVGNDASLL